MSKLNQVIAVEKGIKTRVNERVTALYKSVQKPALFDGMSKTYAPSASGEESLPPEKKLVQMKANPVLDEVAGLLTELFDVTATKDFANCTALADVTVDGQVVLAKAPATFLLFLEKQVTDLHTLVSNLPTLDPAYEWTWDANAAVFKTEPEKTNRTKKVQKPLVLYPATDKHPAQTQVISEDIVVGVYDLVRMSGAVPEPFKRALQVRIEALGKAVKYAREQANTVDAPNKEVGAKIFDWILGRKAKG